VKENASIMRDTKKCYIRRANLHWVEGKLHHQNALELYMNRMGEPGEGIEIETPHVNGGMFKAKFSRINEHVYQYVDEYHNTVAIMMDEPEHVGFINRIRD
jgi:hypothetical protein